MITSDEIRLDAIGVVLKDQDDLAFIAPRLDAILMGTAA